MLDSDYKKYIKYKTKYLNLRGGTLSPVQIEIYKLLLIKLKLLQSLLSKVTKDLLISNILNKVNNNINSPPSEKQYVIKILDPIRRLQSDIQKTEKAYMEQFYLLADPYVVTYIITVVEKEVIYYGYYEKPYYMFGQVKSDKIENLRNIKDLLKIKESAQEEKSAQIVEEFAEIVEESAKIVEKSPRLYYFGRVPEHDMEGRKEYEIPEEQSKSDLLEVLTKIEKLLQSRSKSIKMRNSDDSVNITYIDIVGDENLSTKSISIEDINSTRKLSINYNKGTMDFDDVETMSHHLKKQFENDELIIILFDIDVLHLFHEKFKLFKKLHDLNEKIIIIFPSRIYNLDSSNLEKYMEGLSNDIELSSLSEPQLEFGRKPLNPNTYLIVFSVQADRNLKNEPIFPLKISFTFTSEQVDVLNKIKNNEPFLTALLAWIRRKNPANCFENTPIKLIISNVTHSEKILTIYCMFEGSPGSIIAFSEEEYVIISQLFAITTLDITTDANSKYSYFVPGQFKKNLTLMCSKKICTD